MDRNDLTLAIAGALIAAFLLGWMLRWAFARLNAAGPRNAARTADLAARLHAAEDAPGPAERRLAEVEAEASRRVLELQSEVESARATRSPRPRSRPRTSAPPTVGRSWSGAENRPRRRRPEAGSTPTGSAAAPPAVRDAGPKARAAAERSATSAARRSDVRSAPRTTPGTTGTDATANRRGRPCSPRECSCGSSPSEEPGG